MAKSSFLDDVISGSAQLPRNYRSRYLSELWDSSSDNTYNTYRYATINGFREEANTILKGNGYIYINDKTNFDNQTVFNMISEDLLVTLNNQFLPVERQDISADTKNKIGTKYTAPPNWLMASITALKGGSKGKEIPILFPSSFSRSRNANFARENPIGSETPIVAYSYTDAEEIPLEFDALVDYLPTGFNTLSSYVNEVLNILTPKRGTGQLSNIIYEPKVLVQIADISFVGVCTNVNVSYDNLYTELGVKEGNVTKQKGSFVHAKISCQFIKLYDN